MILNALFYEQPNFKNDSLKLNHFYAQINRGHLRQAGGYCGRNVMKKKNNKDEDNSPKTLIDDNNV